ncbi:MAG TPA: SDR family NAD(P)-dependent oxidoreductase, partial [Acidimicrobiales bacterium]|nr:SDR family NAD(P)-dependent oxidoreductase [Acidimicrobiales bacterium]
MDIQGSSSVITGGASGLGEATARLLASKGQHVVIVDMNADRGEAVAKEIGGLFVKADVANPEQVIAAVEAAKEMGPVKTLVTAAGIGAAQRTIGKDGRYESAYDLDNYRKIIEVNLVGTFNCVRL